MEKVHKEMIKLKFDTLAVHAGSDPDPATGAIIPPIYQTATYALEEVGKNRGFDYSRASNPTRQNLEEALAALESGRFAIAFSSGLSAVDAVLRLLKPGDHIVASEDMYGGVIRLMDNFFIPYGISVTYVDTTDSKATDRAFTPSTKMLWIETPSNPLLRITDLAAMRDLARSHDVLYAVDPTFATPALLRPMEYGADLVVQSTTKYLSGHNQLIGGAVIVNRDDLFEKLKFAQKAIGAVPGPMDCFLTQLGIKTLHLRMERHSANAMKVAEFLQVHPSVDRVIYPGLPSHPQHEVAKEQMKSFSGMISLELKGGVEAGARLMNRVRLCKLAESLGAVETMVTHPATMTHAEVPRAVREARGLTDGFVRISVGIEDPEDIIQDIKSALK
ncbi:MAG TPA: PLP-dependent aspartate aminotransferase family protein [Thermoanaerobaculia bacterium]|nr:PLP-dependent aspartate aminotransferase family protein [Thermoanaerobaculia bacterium]HXK69097.1 PLP-dependent aspartate aminotransferase family protein [Thermoanaerobaculia bacterium]